MVGIESHAVDSRGQRPRTAIILFQIQQTKKPAQPKGCTDSFMILCVFAKGNYSAASSASFILAKHSLQYTGRSSLGWKGTLASLPQAAQVAVYI